MEGEIPLSKICIFGKVMFGELTSFGTKIIGSRFSAERR